MEKVKDQQKVKRTIKMSNVEILSSNETRKIYQEKVKEWTSNCGNQTVNEQWIDLENKIK